MTRHPETHVPRDIENRVARYPDAPPPGDGEDTAPHPPISQSLQYSLSAEHTEVQNRLTWSNMLFLEPEMPHDLPFRPFAIRSVLSICYIRSMSSQNTNGAVLRRLHGPPHQSLGYMLTRTPSSDRPTKTHRAVGRTCQTTHECSILERAHHNQGPQCGWDAKTGEPGHWHLVCTHTHHSNSMHSIPKMQMGVTSQRIDRPLALKSTLPSAPSTAHHFP